MKNFSRLLIVGFVSLSLSTFGMQQVLAQASEQNIFLNRGEIVSRVVQGLHLKSKKAEFLTACSSHLEECFFVFSSRSNFHKLTLEPLFLYPDVPQSYRYYDEVNVASTLGLVQGYFQQAESPFHPWARMTRIEALKVLLGGADAVKWQERFEVVSELGNEDNLTNQTTDFSDVKGSIEHMWWYARYLKTALEKNIIDKETFFRPDENITEKEFNDMLNRTIMSVS